MFKNKQEGLTLVELLTVIVIIGILATVTLISLELARERARDSAIQQQMDQLRKVAEASYDFPQGYERLRERDEVDVVETEVVAIGPGNIAEENRFVLHISDDNQQYCAYARLVVNSDEAFCVDSQGNSRKHDVDSINCHHVDNDGEHSCTNYVECVADGDCGMGEQCVDGECVPE